MQERSGITTLRRLVAAFEPVGDRPGATFGLGAGDPDAALGGLRRAALHEVAAASQADVAAAAGFTLGLSMRAIPEPARGPTKSGRSIMWIRQAHAEAETGKLYPPGLRQMGLAPERLVQVRLRHAREVLRAAVEAAACGALGAVVIEPWGTPAVLDLTATRRLALAAEASGTAVFLLRPTGVAGATVARTRWQVRAAASRPLEANAPGHPAFEVTLLRHQAGRDGLVWRLEWNNEHACFTEPALLRPVASLPADRPAAADGRTSWRRAG